MRRTSKAIGTGASSMHGPARFRVAPDRRAAAAELRQTRQDLEAAASAEAFVLYYQPRVRLQSRQPSGAEALIRWPQRRRGLIPPTAFLPLAEESGAILRIGAWALRTACADARAWQDEPVSVNISARQIAEGAVLGHLADALERTGLPPESLVVELTETMLANMSLDGLLTLSAIRDLGVGIAVDDFGSGLASLSVLRRLPLTALKLDRSLVRDLPAGREDAAVVRAIIAASHALGLSVIAEGIETEAQRSFLADIGCDEGQGFLFGQPVPAEQLNQTRAARPQLRLPTLVSW
jgi:EAL domain-containing protein (putative c-di-GMP-specific phosphodiesterase class I)